MSFFAMFIPFNVLTALYFGIRLYQNFSHVFPSLLRKKILYILIIAAFSQFYIAMRMLYRSMDAEPSAFMLYTISTMLAIYILALFIMMLFDLILLVSWILRGVLPLYAVIHAHTSMTAAIYFAAVALIYLFGLYMASVPRETYYTIQVDKPMAVEQLRIVEISDLHVASFTRQARVEKLVEQINSLKPDIVFVVGDLLDGEQAPFNEKRLDEVFKGLKARYGVFSALGNHEYHGEGLEGVVDLFDRSNLGLLRDQSVYIPELGVSIVGRNDLSGQRRSLARASASELFASIDMTKPVIVIDHQPQAADDAMLAGADLQFSGHTHNGQMFPANFIVKSIYEKPWGLLEKGAFKLITSCGVGTWGPPIRIGSYSEIVVVDLQGN